MFHVQSQRLHVTYPYHQANGDFKHYKYNILQYNNVKNLKNVAGSIAAKTDETTVHWY